MTCAGWLACNFLLFCPMPFYWLWYSRHQVGPCMSGPDVWAWPGCGGRFDADTDGDVDLRDWAEYQNGLDM
jgi:hypothetical protein